MTASVHLRAGRDRGEEIGALAAECLELETATYPKPGLVSRVDAGSHEDMDAPLLDRSARALGPFFASLWDAGASGSEMARLRTIGVDAERAMMRATKGVNTHRGAIFGLGLLSAAAGFRELRGTGGTLGALVAKRWGTAILTGPVAVGSHGTRAGLRHGARGARGEAAAGFPSLYEVGLPALALGRRLSSGGEEAARVQTCMTLIAHVEDTNLLHRGGAAGLQFAQAAARAFLERGGVGRVDWRARAVELHRAFVSRRLSPGGCADLLAMTLFVDRTEGGCSR